MICNGGVADWGATVVTFVVGFAIVGLLVVVLVRGITLLVDICDRSIVIRKFVFQQFSVFNHLKEKKVTDDLNIGKMF